MKIYIAFKLIYLYLDKEKIENEHFMRVDEKLKRAENIIQLSFVNSSALDKETIKARCKLWLKENGFYSGEPTQILYYDFRNQSYSITERKIKENGFIKSKNIFKQHTQKRWSLLL